MWKDHPNLWREKQVVDSSPQLFTAERTLSDLTSTLNCMLSCSLYMLHSQSFSLSHRALAFQMREWMNFLFQMPFHRLVKRRCSLHSSQFAAMREYETKHIFSAVLLNSVKLSAEQPYAITNHHATTFCSATKWASFSVLQHIHYYSHSW